MKDLDMSDVLADAQRMEDHFRDEMYRDFEAKSDAQLGHERYKLGPLARQGNPYSVMIVEMIDFIMLTRINTTLCEGCLGRWGCDMCNPPQFDMMDMIPAGTPDSWIPDNPNEDGFRQSDFI